MKIFAGGGLKGDYFEASFVVLLIAQRSKFKRHSIRIRNNVKRNLLPTRTKQAQSSFGFCTSYDQLTAIEYLIMVFSPDRSRMFAII